MASSWYDLEEHGLVRAVDSDTYNSATGIANAAVVQAAYARIDASGVDPLYAPMFLPAGDWALAGTFQNFYDAGGNSLFNTPALIRTNFRAGAGHIFGVASDEIYALTTSNKGPYTGALSNFVYVGSNPAQHSTIFGITGKCGTMEDIGISGRPFVNDAILSNLACVTLARTVTGLGTGKWAFNRVLFSHAAVGQQFGARSNDSNPGTSAGNNDVCVMTNCRYVNCTRGVESNNEQALSHKWYAPTFDPPSDGSGSCLYVNGGGAWSIYDPTITGRTCDFLTFPESANIGDNQAGFDIYKAHHDNNSGQFIKWVNMLGTVGDSARPLDITFHNLEVQNETYKANSRTMFRLVGSVNVWLYNPRKCPQKHTVLMLSRTAHQRPFLGVVGGRFDGGNGVSGNACTSVGDMIDPASSEYGEVEEFYWRQIGMKRHYAGSANDVPPLDDANYTVE